MVRRGSRGPPFAGNEEVRVLRLFQTLKVNVQGLPTEVHVIRRNGNPRRTVPVGKITPFIYTASKGSGPPASVVALLTSTRDSPDSKRVN